MKYSLTNAGIKVIAIICASLLFIAIFNLPQEYYKVLRVVIFMGTLLLLIEKFNNVQLLLVFLLIAFLFNPIIPVYLQQKSLWIPIDIICGLIFLLEAFYFTNKKVNKKFKPNKKQKIKTYTRDIIH